MRVLVTGASGFLGSHVADQLSAAGHQVVALVRKSSKVDFLKTLKGVELAYGDVADRDSIREAVKGADAVIHSAGAVKARSPEEFHQINVGGTERILAACQAAGVPKLVHTSSPSCTFGGGDHEGVREADCPYPERFDAIYPETKARAERLILGANSPTLATVSLRPHLIYGPEDPHLLPRVVARAAQGRLAIVGDGENRVGLTYVDNAAAAHRSAADALPGACAGRAYFITDPEPVALWPWINRVLAALGIAPVTRRVPLGLARVLGTVMETIWPLFGLKGEPPMTRFVARQLATSHWYDLTGAITECHYAPPVSGEVAFERTIAWLRSRT